MWNWWCVELLHFVIYRILIMIFGTSLYSDGIIIFFFFFNQVMSHYREKVLFAQLFEKDFHYLEIIILFKIWLFCLASHLRSLHTMLIPLHLGLLWINSPHILELCNLFWKTWSHLWKWKNLIHLKFWIEFFSKFIKNNKIKFYICRWLFSEVCHFLL